MRRPKNSSTKRNHCRQQIHESCFARCERLTEQNKKLAERIKRLEALLATKVDARSSRKPVFTENYNLHRNKLGSQNSDKKPPKKSTGRKPAEAKELRDNVAASVVGGAIVTPVPVHFEASPPKMGQLVRGAIEAWFRK